MRVQVPVEPIKRVLEEAIAQAKIDEDNMPRTQGWTGNNLIVSRVIDIICRYTESPACVRPYKRSAVTRNIYRIRTGTGMTRGRPHRVLNVSFEWADIILCALDRQHEWQDDPVLREVYDSLLDTGQHVSATVATIARTDLDKCAQRGVNQGRAAEPSDPKSRPEPLSNGLHPRTPAPSNGRVSVPKPEQHDRARARA